ncbi:MAG: DUF3307 domain-containing protein [Caldilineaceae bacterium]|jgi:hypothetical protein
MTLPTDILVWAIVLHLVADWPLQNEWMACNKTDLRRPAAWVHSGIHTCLLLLVFPWLYAVAIGITHLLIDTRVPVQWWNAHYKHMPPGVPLFDEIELWMDQVFHIIVLAAAVVLLTLSS